MGYYDHDEDPAPTGRDGLSTAQQVLAICVRLLGVVVLVAGAWTAVIVITEAWGLYREPERIERFAAAIERGSNLDQAFAPRRRSASGGREDDSPAVAQQRSETTAGYDSVRLSYFVGWLVALGLMLVLGILAMSAISTGGQLALYDMQVKRLSRQIVREVQRVKKAA